MWLIESNHIFFIVFIVQVQLSPFYPHPSHPYLPPSILLPFGFVHVSFIDVPENPSLSPLHYPLPHPL